MTMFPPVPPELLDRKPEFLPRRRLVSTLVTCCIVTLCTPDAALAQVLSERDFLSGGLDGKREELSAQGFDVELIFTGEYLHNFDGGIDTGGDFRWDTSLFLSLDTETAGWWDSGEFHVHVQAQGGDGITEDEVGDFQVLSNIDADDYVQVSEIWYRHRFADDTSWVKLGKMEANEDFAFVDYGGEFLNSSPGFSPTIPLVTYPDQDWGIVIHYAPVEQLSVNLGIYQANADGGRSIGNTIDDLSGPLVLVEPSFHYTLRGLPGTLRLGGWWSRQDIETLDGTDTDESAAGFYATWDQLVYRPSDADSDSERGVGVFAQLGFSQSEHFEAEAYYGAGVQWAGPTASRPNDILGVGVFHTELSNDGGFANDSETAIEFFYRAEVAPWLIVKPDLQYIVNPGGSNNDDAFVVGLRTEIAF